MENAELIGKAISAIYEASLKPSRWDDALVSIAEAMQASQSALVFLEGNKLKGGSMPLMDPIHIKARAEISSFAEGHDSLHPAHAQPLGKVAGFDIPAFREQFENSAEYKEWWNEHDLGMGALFANVSQNGARLAQIGIYRPQKAGFNPTERARFAMLCEHLVRASRIHNRIKLGALAEKGSEKHGYVGLAAIDNRFRVLGQDKESVAVLCRLGLARASRTGDKEIIPNDNLKKLIANAQPPTRRAGSCWQTSSSGERIWIDVMPVEQGQGRIAACLDQESPAALLQFSLPEKRAALRLRGLATEFGLTPAEEAVAREIVKGDGRAAAARRLNISESTVRSHLSVVFEKVGIHRQSELIRLLAG